MALLPCVLCGKEIYALGGRNTIYYPKTRQTYAYCSGGCEGKGSYDDSHIYALIDQMPDEERRRSHLPD